MVILLSVSAHAQSTAACTITNFDYPGSPATAGQGINNQGAIAGTYLAPDGFNTAFVWQNGSYSTFRFPNSRSTESGGINNKGYVVGDYLDASGVQRGFLLKSGMFYKVWVPGASSVLAEGINDAYDIVGWYTDARGEHGFLKHGPVTVPFDYPGSRETVARAINNRGVITGTYSNSTGGHHGFILDEGQWATIDFPGASDTSPLGVNDNGDVVGNYFLNGRGHGFIYSIPAKTWETVDAATTAESTIPFAMNINNEMTGSYVDSTGHQHGFRASCQ